MGLFFIIFGLFPLQMKTEKLSKLWKTIGKNYQKLSNTIPHVVNDHNYERSPCLIFTVTRLSEGKLLTGNHRIPHERCGLNQEYCPLPSGVLKHGVLENGPVIDYFPFETSIQFGEFPANHVWSFDYQSVSTTNIK